MTPSRKASAKDGRKSLGAYGERLAAELLQDKGYRILHTNWRCRTGELDLIAEDGSTLVFVEVRTRRATGRFGTPEESVNARKQQQIRETAQMYLYWRQAAYERKLRFDVVAVHLDIEGVPVRVEHLEEAF